MLKKVTRSFLLASMLLGSSFGPALLAAPASQKSAKPFLIQGQLPHYTMMVKQMWNDRDLALTPAQKKELLKVRKATLTQIKKLKPEIMQLQQKIVTAAQNGATPESLKEDVYKLAKLRADATMVHLQCIYDTKKILTQDQLDILE